eukprot:Plantae.Rhodophyta-Rhodochaete_pulchella.ctg1062.p3 GENE.Plantae.Rhodophyta-Rhodochaete_pulchella.ctg1062~~Plantae.Rhodophyta-Rhodochaete_pulchella.ctg1062.p3  ORF type:complete len:106 (+),score=9.63 Plantae.Rhodophyta-Rhodochaete_pulchella.ctg1062:200-517(+)
MKEITGFEFDIHLIVDHKGTYDLVTSTQSPRELLPNLNIAQLRERFEHSGLTRVSWTPSKLQYADSLTRLNPAGATKLNQVANCRILSRDLSRRETRYCRTFKKG